MTEMVFKKKLTISEVFWLIFSETVQNCHDCKLF